jgi:mono/diheme cytochrome c family protein
MNEQKQIKNYQIAVIMASSLLILLLLTAWYFSGSGLEWKKYQKDYEAMIVELQDSLPGISYFDKGAHQFELEGLQRIDRCASCHMGIENSDFADKEQPFASHPGSYLEDHPADKYGCTICHGGQGRAMNEKDAHALEPSVRWDHQLLSQPYLQSSCGQCHLAIFGEQKSFAGTEVYQHGQHIFNREGCLGCHKARGVGGILGPDLTEQGEKTSHEYSFQNIETERTIYNWLKEHFRDPEMVSPGSQMLKIDLPEEDLDALSTFVLGLIKPDISFEYLTLEALNEFKGHREILKGEKIYSMACSACHGKEGEGKDYEEFATGVPGILERDFLRVASENYIAFTLMKGRSQRQMSSWTPHISGLKNHELEELVTYMKTFDSRQDLAYKRNLYSRSDEEAGKIVFDENCASCHGLDGKGELAISINNTDLLRNADNEFLFSTIIKGRMDAAMPAWTNLSEEDLHHLLRYIRSWQAYSPVVSSLSLEAGDPMEGKLKYHFTCSRCHGEAGQGQTGPAIINEDFLALASDLFLYNTIASGRSHSSMIGWNKDVYNAERLGDEDITNIIAFIREEASKKPDYIYAGSNPGSKERGEPLFQKYCSECHGKEGEGTKAPALHNQELLSAATNGYLLATVSVGREGSAMPRWGKEEKGHQMLTAQEREDIVAYVRSWQRIKIKNNTNQNEN